MDYRESLKYLDSFVNYEKTGHVKKNKFSLDGIKRLAGILENPQESFKTIHIAGTKGKGSVAAFVASVLEEAGYKTGVYTSPHLIDPRERIRVNGIMINENDFASHVSLIKRRFKENALKYLPSYFELYTILVFLYFREKNIDYAVIETGMGGRLDATNIVNPVVSVLSSISYDHTDILGGTLKEIASEKSGIIKRNSVVVSAPQEDSALGVIKEKCESLGARLILVGKDVTFEEVACDPEKEIFNINGRLGRYENCVTGMLGRHQIINAAAAAAAAEALTETGASIEEKDIKTGIQKTKNPGRCEIISKRPFIVIDGAHNRASAAAIRDTIKRNFNPKRVILVIGASSDKDIKGMCDELEPASEIIIITKSGIKRAAEPRDIKKFIGKEALLTGSVSQAVRKALSLAGPEDLILITGSFYVISEAKKEVNVETKKITV